MSIDENQQDELDLREELEAGVEETPADEVAEETPPEPEIEPLQPLEAWQDDWKENFNKFNDLENGRDFQQMSLDWYKSMQGDYTRKTQMLADERRQFEQDLQTSREFHQAFKPLKDYAARNGMPLPILANSLVTTFSDILRDPQNGWLRLGEQLQIDTTKAIEEQPYIDPEVRTLKEQNMQMQNQLNQFQQQYQQGQQTQHNEAILSQIEQFKQNAPHFDKVENDMATLITMGKAKDLQEAYDIAIQYNADVQKEISEKAKKEELAKQQAEVKKAKNATTRITSKSKEAPAPELSLREQLEANYDAAS